MACLSARGQAARVNIQQDSLRWYSFIAVNAGADMIGAAKTLLQDDLDWLNFYASAEFYKFSFHAEYGRESRTFDNGTDRYVASGSYYRFGPNFNFLFKDPDRSALFIGARYAVNSFSDELDYSVPNPFWGDQRGSLENDKLSADWIELVAGIKVKLFQAVWMGYTGRFKGAVDTFEDQTLIPGHIPGYGASDKRSTWEFNYWLIIRIPFRKTPQEMTLDLR